MRSKDFEYFELEQEGLSNYLQQLHAMTTVLGKETFKESVIELYKQGFRGFFRQLKNETVGNPHFEHYFGLKSHERLCVDTLDLTETDFRYANLQGMVFNGGNFTGADFTDAKLPDDMFHPGITEKKANFVGAVGLSERAKRIIKNSGCAYTQPEELPVAVMEGALTFSQGYTAVTNLKQLAKKEKNSDTQARYLHAADAVLAVMASQGRTTALATYGMRQWQPEGANFQLPTEIANTITRKLTNEDLANTAMVCLRKPEQQQETFVARLSREDEQAKTHSLA